MTTNVAPSDRYDVVCLGGGTAGMTAARAARLRGKSVLLVERETSGSEARLGGDCTWWGCVPSKALVEVARLAERTRQLADLGFEPPRLDLSRVKRRTDSIVGGIARDEAPEAFRRIGVDVLPGRARFEDAHHLRIEGRVVEADRVVVAVGTDPAVPPFPGLAEAPHLTNRTVFDLTELPRRLLVLGGGATGLELGQAFGRLGSRVAVIEQLDRLLPAEDAEAGRVVEEALRAEGIDLRLSTRAERVERRGQEIAVAVSGGEELVGDALLVAAGRRAGTPELGAEAAGIELERGFVKVDRRMRTSADGVYAAGDVTGSLMYTHVAAHEGRIAGANAAGRRLKADYRVVPWVTFTDPELARVGLTEAEAREAHGDAVEVARFPMRLVDRARILGEERGFVKLVTLRRGFLGRQTGGKLVGAHVVGPRAGEILHEAVVAMQARSFAGRLAQAIHAYPSTSIAVQQAASQLFREGRAQVPTE